MDKRLHEEIDGIVANHKIFGWIRSITANDTAINSIRLDVNCVTARALAKAMWSNNTLVALNLSRNNLDDHAGSYLARMVKENATLYKVGDAAAVTRIFTCLNLTLFWHPQLIKLELDSNELGPRTCKEFGKSLQVNTVLRFLSLDWNPLCPVTGNTVYCDTGFPASSGSSAEFGGGISVSRQTARTAFREEWPSVASRSELVSDEPNYNHHVETRDTSGIEGLAEMFAHNFSLTSLSLLHVGLDPKAGGALLGGMKSNLYDQNCPLHISQHIAHPKC